MTTPPDQRASGRRGQEPGGPEQLADPRPPEQRAVDGPAAERTATDRPGTDRLAADRLATGTPGGEAAGQEVPAGAHARPPGPRRPGATGGTGTSGAAPARPPRDLPRWVRWTVLPLLVLVPLGYVIISAQQSRESGESKQQEAAARHLTFGYYPSTLQQRIYEMPVPFGAAHVGYLETNSWDTSVLFTQFTTTAGGLDYFLAKLGTSREELRAGTSAIDAAQARAVGWTFGGPGPWSGTTMHKAGDKPDHAISVDLHDPDLPTVYVVSTVNFQHGFGGN